MADDLKFNSNVKNLHYKAPEIIKGEEDDDERSDIWSIGILMHLLLTGRLPFDGTSDEQIKQKIQKGEVDMKNGEIKNVSKEAKNLLK